MPVNFLTVIRNLVKKTNLNKHVEEHTVEKNHAGHSCDYRTKFECDLKNHLKTHNLGTQPYICEFLSCDEASSLEQNMPVHIEGKKIYDKRFVNLTEKQVSSTIIEPTDRTGEPSSSKYDETQLIDHKKFDSAGPEPEDHLIHHVQQQQQQQQQQFRLSDQRQLQEYLAGEDNNQHQDPNQWWLEDLQKYWRIILSNEGEFL